jgi:hypothetical protein
MVGCSLGINWQPDANQESLGGEGINLQVELKNLESISPVLRPDSEVGALPMILMSSADHSRKAGQLG